MKSLVKVKLPNGAQELVNEEQICRITRGRSGTFTAREKVVCLHLSNGEILEITEPPFDQWENDLFVRQS